ncbi:exopolyphosphatase [Neptuniibacter sp. CAU 1671]|uniref:exopolyphosphatase n=1 Tax=Neptuniibacter sp. CAU 1671 TaxID=3032593 RepID=UPI0023D98C32|nr:exopolyphosphatase [Neptuniibacter sp. CAU 1671]MDF2182629.1 exopolyphosphatase [Neptuniibacter sp. CAU 1671]
MTENTPASPIEESQLLAAIDLGSNSFHMVVAQHTQGEIRPLDILSEKVQLAAGIDSNGMLMDDAWQRGLECLSRFAQRISELPRENIRAVGTNALREAQNSQAFIEAAEKVIGAPLEIIAGREEARLIYLGVAHTLSDDHGPRLVVDIGGGSTEFIIGERFEPHLTESLHIGCVSYSQYFFPDGKITTEGFKRAYTTACRELLAIRAEYQKHGWTSSVGASGTIKAIRNVCSQLGWCEDTLTLQALNSLKERILKVNHFEKLDLPGLKAERLHLLPAGCAILCAIFDTLNVERMEFSDGALREGVLYDMVGRLQHEDVRDRTINALMQRYHVDTEQAERVENTALIAWAQVKQAWNLNTEHYDMLSWAARTHEIGLTIAHSQYHKHSAYLLNNSDLPGFTNQSQLQLATLVRGHRRKFPKDEFKALPERLQEPFTRLCVLLRLSVVLNRSRSKDRLPGIEYVADGKKLTLCFPEGWLEHHPLTHAELEQEAEYLCAANFKFKCQ